MPKSLWFKNPIKSTQIQRIIDQSLFSQFLEKIFEGLLSERLVTFLEQNKIITKYQAGYRRGRSTQEHIFRLSQQVFNGFKQRKCTIAVLLDVEAAFDAVWTNGLIFKLAHLNLPSNFLRILCSFLKDRSLSVHLEGTVSRSIYLKAGTPQGACLSPILFNIYVNDIPFDDMTDCDPSQFADDTGIWCTGLDTANTGSKIQNSLSLMENWCKKWRVKLSPSKTNVLLFTRCYKAHQNKPTLMLFNEQLTYVNEANFLGVKFDTRLTWEPQIRQLMTKAQPRINLLRALTPLTPREGLICYSISTKQLFGQFLNTLQSQMSMLPSASNLNFNNNKIQ